MDDNPDKFTSIYAAMETADCEKKLKAKEILPLKVDSRIRWMMRVYHGLFIVALYVAARRPHGIYIL
jgi:hypothetical protein